MPSKKHGPCWKAILNKEEKKLDILLHEDIGFWGTQSKDFAQLMIDNKDVDVINVDLDCRGGSCKDGFAIYNFLNGHKAKVNIKVHFAASMASVILMAGDTVDGTDNSVVMFHKPWIEYASGNADDFKGYIDSLDKLEAGIVKAYQKRMDKTDIELKAILKKTTYYSAEQAQDLNIIDTISEDIPVLNKFDFDAYGYSDAPDNIREKYDKNYKSESSTPDNNILNKIANMLNLKKEPGSMADNKELQTKFNALSDKFTILEKKFTDKEASDKIIIEDQAKVISNLKEQIVNNTVNSSKGKLKGYCENLVKEGKMKPVDVDTHVDVLHGRLEEDKKGFTEEKQETPLLDSYKNILESAPVAYDMGGHFADKNNADNGGKNVNEAKLQAAINKLVKESGMTHGKAYQAVLRDNPEWR